MWTSQFPDRGLGAFGPPRVPGVSFKNAAATIDRMAAPGAGCCRRFTPGYNDLSGKLIPKATWCRRCSRCKFCKQVLGLEDNTDVPDNWQQLLPQLPVPAHWSNYKLYNKGVPYSEKLIVHYKLGQAYSARDTHAFIANWYAHITRFCTISLTKLIVHYNLFTIRHSLIIKLIV